MLRKEITREATLGQLLDETVAKYPDNEAIVYADRNYRETWSEFSGTVDRVAKGLMALGVKKGDKVAVWATNVPHWVALQFATAKIGAILLTININYKSTEIEYVLKQSDCENIFIIDGYRDTDYVAIMYELIPELQYPAKGQAAHGAFPAPAAGHVPGSGEAPGHVLDAGGDGAGGPGHRRRVQGAPDRR